MSAGLYSRRRVARHAAGAGILAMLIFMGSGASGKKPYMAPPPINTFDGKTWAGITLGATTRRNIKDQVRTDDSGYRDALQMKQPKEAGMHIEALCAGKDKPVTEILLRYDGDGPPETTIIGGMGGVRMVRRYESGRLEDWWLDIWPDIGVVAFVNAKSVQHVALASPANAMALSKTLSETETPVIVRPDPHAGEPKVSTIGSAVTTFDLHGIRMDESAERLYLERHMRQAAAGGTLRYVEGAPGSYQTRISGNYRADKGGSLRIECTISGRGPYGPVGGSGSSYVSLAKDPYGARGSGVLDSFNYLAGAAKAMKEAERDFELSMTIQGPPPVAPVRLAAWKRMVEDLRSSSM